LISTAIEFVLPKPSRVQTIAAQQFRESDDALMSCGMPELCIYSSVIDDLLTASTQARL
jgi:hypothetical protein